MPPKVKITREEIVLEAIEIVRKSGIEAVNARSIAAVLGCSTQPIFSNFSTMDELKEAILVKCEGFYMEYAQNEVQKGVYPVYKANGMAYIKFAKEERELFKLLFMRDRSTEGYSIESELNNRMESIVHNNTGLENDKMKLFHMEMWAYVHGIAAMFATGYFDIEWDVVSRMLTDSYQGLLKQYKIEV
ncbi:MAG: TetR/AcrR family transcriptional regulator [Clostridiales bacterium]|nr:TetR/AcrR family transcriptional regulator [Clostridiales bacterium]